MKVREILQLGCQKSHRCYARVLPHELAHLCPEVVAQLLQLGMQLGARLGDSLFGFDISVGLDAHLNTLLERMGLLVACKSHSLVSEQLVANHVAQRVVLRLDEEGRGVLAACIIHTLDEIARLGLSRPSSLVSTTGSSCHLLVA